MLLVGWQLSSHPEHAVVGCEECPQWVTSMPCVRRASPALLQVAMRPATLSRRRSPEGSPPPPRQRAPHPGGGAWRPRGLPPTRACPSRPASVSTNVTYNVAYTHEQRACKLNLLVKARNQIECFHLLSTVRTGSMTVCGLSTQETKRLCAGHAGGSVVSAATDSTLPPDPSIPSNPPSMTGTLDDDDNEAQSEPPVSPTQVRVLVP